MKVLHAVIVEAELLEGISPQIEDKIVERALKRYQSRNKTVFDTGQMKLKVKT